MADSPGCLAHVPVNLVRAIGWAKARLRAVPTRGHATLCPPYELLQPATQSHRICSSLLRLDVGGADQLAAGGEAAFHQRGELFRRAGRDGDPENRELLLHIRRGK